MPLTFLPFTKNFRKSGGSTGNTGGGETVHGQGHGWFQGPPCDTYTTVGTGGANPGLLETDETGWSPVSLTANGWSFWTNSIPSGTYTMRFMENGSEVTNLVLTSGIRSVLGSVGSVFPAVTTANVDGLARIGARGVTATSFQVQLRPATGLQYTTANCQQIISLGGPGGGGTATLGARGTSVQIATSTVKSGVPGYDAMAAVGWIGQFDTLAPLGRKQVPVHRQGMLENFTVAIWSGASLFPFTLTVTINSIDSPVTIAVTPTINVFTSAAVASLRALDLLSLRADGRSWGTGSVTCLMALATFRPTSG